MSPGVIISQARKRAGITQAELAKRLGTTQSAIARLESGPVSPSFDRVVAVVEACGFELDLWIHPANSAERATIRRNLTLSPSERVARVVTMANFIRSGRAALKAGESNA
jgi:transcriptional regulator with XRE-family HTH domain